MALKDKTNKNRKKHFVHNSMEFPLNARLEVIIIIIIIIIIINIINNIIIIINE